MSAMIYLYPAEPDPYCEVTCGRKTVKTSVCDGTHDPFWDERITFYQKDKEIKIEVIKMFMKILFTSELQINFDIDLIQEI
jgi:hypothetical protein